MLVTKETNEAPRQKSRCIGTRIFFLGIMTKNFYKIISNKCDEKMCAETLKINGVLTRT